MVHRFLQQVLPFKYQVATYTLGVMLAASVYTSEWKEIADEAIWYGNSALDWGNSIYDVCARNLQGSA
jgi:hypothetical protein